MKFLVALIPVALALVGLLPLLGVMLLWKRNVQRQVTESPLTKNLLRPPGYSLRKKIDNLNLDIDLYLMSVVAIPLLVFAIHISQSYFTGEPESILRIGFSMVLGIGLVVLVCWRLLPLMSQRRLDTLGLEGELATGEELNQLMLDGCRVFHDIPFPYGNIDHVVVSHSGVFSVNSKMLRKAKNAKSNAKITVDQQRSIVRFPNWEYQIEVEKLETEANWLSKHLTSAVGNSVNVEAMLALPGWYVKERIGRGSVYVFNPNKPQKFFLHERQVLSPALVQQIAHQLEYLCRDVEPSHREKRERWENQK